MKLFGGLSTSSIPPRRNSQVLPSSLGREDCRAVQGGREEARDIEIDTNTTIRTGKQL